MGDKTPTYNFCGIGHMGEMEDEPVQDAAAPFIATGADPVVDGTALKGFPCLLNSSEFSVTGKEDARSIEISRLAAATPASVGPRARAAQAPVHGAGRLSLAEAEKAGLVEVMYDEGRTVFVTNRPVAVRVAGEGTTQVTPITGEGKRGAAVVYDGPVEVTARGAKTQSSVAGHPADVRAPRTTAKVRRTGARRVITLTASDRSGVAVTMVQVGRARPRPYRRALKVGRRTTVRYWSVDTFGNAERKRLVKR